MQRYAARLNAVEINSSFYRPHQQRLGGCGELLDDFLAQVTCLGQHLGCLLVQLPPSLAFDAAVAESFLWLLRQRHASWFTAPADSLLRA